MTEAERTSAQAEEQEQTSAQAEEQEQTTGTNGLLGKIVETAKNVVETVTETAKDVAETVAERTPAVITSAAASAGSAASAVMERVRDAGGDEPSGQELTAAVAEGGVQMPETRPVAVVEESRPGEGAAPADTGTVADTASAVVEAATAARARLARVYGTAVRPRIARAYEAIADAVQPADQASPATQA